MTVSSAWLDILLTTTFPHLLEYSGSQRRGKSVEKHCSRELKSEVRRLNHDWMKKKIIVLLKKRNLFILCLLFVDLLIAEANSNFDLCNPGVGNYFRSRATLRVYKCLTRATFCLKCYFRGGSCPSRALCCPLLMKPMYNWWFSVPKVSMNSALLALKHSNVNA